MPKHKTPKGRPPVDPVGSLVEGQIEHRYAKFRQLPIPPDVARFAALFLTLAEAVQARAGIDVLASVEADGLPSAGLCLLLLIHDPAQRPLRPLHRLLDTWQQHPQRRADLQCLIAGIIPEQGIPILGDDGAVVETWHRGPLGR